MYYFSARQGFKAGGFDHDLAADQSDPDIDDRFRFDDEEVTALELGMKLTLLGGAMQLNAAIFQMDFDDLQLAGFLDSAGAVGAVTNAASATSEGIEADLRWAATDRLTLSAALAYLDSSYDDYPDAPCYTLQTTGCVNGRQDLSGQKLQFATDWKGNATAEYVWPLTASLDLAGFVHVYYSDEFPLQADLDPKLFQDSFVKWDARVTLGSNDGKWDVSLVGRNLGDELTSHYGDDVPGQAGSVWRSVDSPRSIALQAVLRF
jgi:outer membrane receptor protein involved in Fe transport